MVEKREIIRGSKAEINGKIISPLEKVGGEKQSEARFCISPGHLKFNQQVTALQNKNKETNNLLFL